MRGIFLLCLLGATWASFAQIRSEPKVPQVAQPSGPIDCDKIRNNDLLCLACNIFFESGNQSFQGKIAVGAVTVNRLHHSSFPDSICRVVWQKGQFSWTQDGKSDKVRNKQWWKDSFDVAQGFVMSVEKPHGAFGDPTNCAMFYHATYIKKPYWVKGDRMVETKRIEQHAFYQKPAYSCPFDEEKESKKMALNR